MPSHRNYHDEYGDLDPRVIANELEEFGTDYANAKHAADLLENTTSAVRAELTNLKRKEFPDLSRKECEDLALADPEWRRHQYATADAIREKNLALAKWKAAQAKFEALRTAEATKRAAMHMGSR